MNKLSFALTLMLAIGLAFFGAVLWSVASVGRASPGSPHRVSMAESAAAMQQAADAMAAHAEWMLTEGARTGDPDLIASGQRWMQEAQSLANNAQLMSMNPTAPSSLRASPGELSAQGNWGELYRNAQNMLHDPSQAREIDIDALRWTGLSMQSEGGNMLEQGRRMNQALDGMLTQHALTPPAVAELRQAARTIGEVGGHLQGNGQAMVDYADNLRRMVGR